MTKSRRFTPYALKLAAVAVATLPVLAAVTPGAAAAPSAQAKAPAGVMNALTCTTDTDGWTGHAHCKNNTNQVRAFRAVVVCGAWPDARGAWKTLHPGGSDVSSARCFGGTGVGSVSWQEG
ncbi:MULTISPECIES: hypothetical protein [unclassified Streptomyces]|uniref:hypothetical protein n=1 Tax=unclassified Streptomyces TaxID=2593676 RepID=UPI001CBBBB13|nr:MULTISPECIES: hypothetical protein [unclassified Streptomyces]WPO72988.1 hypothetical protein R9806_21330 [Streptomyces sp. KN37]